MNNIIGKKTLRCLAGGALMVFASMSHAQYLWLNEKGSKVYSDTPPPASIPLKNILKQPGGVPKAVAQEPAAAPAAKPAADAKAPPSLADREADYRKRNAERAEKEKKDTAESTQKRDQKAACESARGYQQTLDSGQRIGTMENGERGYMSDEKRAEAVARNNRTLQDCK